MKDLAYQSATKLAPLIKSKQVSPVELTKTFLDRITKYDKTINSYITPLHDSALKQAKQAENEIMHGNYKGPLHGIPLGIKDNIETKGIRTTAGSKILANYIPEKTATSIQNLTNAGSIILGKQNTHEFAAGTTTINPFYGAARNPWNTEHMTGGSSGGSAAALAAGLTTIAQGTDTIGSIRIPSSMCGTYGLKPTYGLVSNYGGIPTAWSMDVQGPMARSTADLAYMLHYTAAYDPKDPASLHVAPTDYTSHLNKGLSGIKIGVPTYYLENLDPDVEKLFKKSITSLQHLGAEVREIKIPELRMATFAGLVTMSGEASGYHYDWLQTQSRDYGQDIRSFLETGVLSSTAQYMKAQQARRSLIKAFQKAFQEVDILLGPSIPITAPAFQENWVKQNLEVEARVIPFTAPPNLTGMPSLSVPMGRCSKGLPAGMQLMGNFLSEKQLLQAGYAWEETNPLQVKL